VELTQNYFEIFGLPVGFVLDVPALTPTYRELQKRYHPDRFADRPAAEQRLAVQQAALINAAYDALREPVARARYLLELAGHPVAMEKATVSDVDFLNAQMELREELEEVTEIDQLGSLRAEVQDWLNNLIREFGIDYSAQDWPEAADTVRKMQFMMRFLDDVRLVEERLEDAELDS
jgi:molecular chaperone HscB